MNINNRSSNTVLESVTLLNGPSDKLYYRCSRDFLDKYCIELGTGKFSCVPTLGNILTFNLLYVNREGFLVPAHTILDN